MVNAGARTKRRRTWMLASVVILVLIAAAVGPRVQRLLPVLSVGAGLKAGHMCSAVYLAGRAPEAVLREELANIDPRLAYVPDPVVDRASQSVTVPLLFGLMPRRAVYRACMGCTLLPPGAAVTDATPPPCASMPLPVGDPADIPWPDGDLVAEEPLPPEVDGALLSAAVQAAFAEPTDKPFHTIGVVVVYRGRIIAEHYAPGWGPHVQSRTWSTAKSITNALVGILVGEGKLTVDAPAPIPEWQQPGDPRAQITLANLLHMSSGLVSDGAWTPDAYWGGIDTINAITATQLEAEPGARWKYSNYDTLLLARAIQHVIGDKEEYLAFPRRALLNRIGMRDTVMETDPFGNYISSSQVYTTPRDLARFGLLYLHDGVWNGERILPEGWVAYSAATAPASLALPEDAEAYGAYGAQFWLFGRDPRLPHDAYSTSGARGQHSTIVPSYDLVVARMGLDPLQDGGWDQRGFVADILAAIHRDGKERRS